MAQYDYSLSELHLMSERLIEPDKVLHSGQSSLTPAAVLVPVIEREGGAQVLFTRRPETMPDHAGQISFPGGKIESGDRNAIDAALREAEEETGINRAYIEVLGLLDAYNTSTGFRIMPVVAAIAPGFCLQPDESEVEEIFEAPLSFLMNPSNHQQHSRIWLGKQRQFYAMSYKEHFIWGATAGMLVNLYERIYV